MRSALNIILQPFAFIIIGFATAGMYGSTLLFIGGCVVALFLGSHAPIFYLIPLVPAGLMVLFWITIRVMIRISID